jgi:hypothetical protein
MRPPRVRFSLWHIMVVIALFAVVDAWLGVWVASGLLTAASLVAIPIVLTAPRGRLDAAAWVSFIYPVLYTCSLNAIWFTAWFVSRKRPRGFFDDPKFIHWITSGPFLATLYLTFMLILPFVTLMLCVPLMFAAVCQRIRRKEIGAWGAAVRLSVPLCLWVCLYVVARWDLLNIVDMSNWLLDR